MEHSQVTQTPPPNAKRIFVDVSETLALDVRTGIQRVVREVARKASAAQGRFEIIPVVAVSGAFHRLSARGQQQLVAPTVVVHKPAKPARPTIRGRAAKLLLAPFPGLIKRLQAWRDARGMDRMLDGFWSGPAVQPGPGDRVVLADTYYLSSALEAGAAAARNGAALIALTYDLIPISHPHLHDVGMVDHFMRAVPRGMELSDGVLTISDWCIGEIQRLGVTKPLGRFYLGYDIPTPAGEAPDPAAWPAGLWDGDVPVFLMVGTITTNKGHPVALQAFERLWSEGVECRLLMVGRAGWEVDTLIRQINEHPQFGRQLFMVHGASDAMVDEAFRRAHAAIIGSIVEGFGLPLVEALARGLPVIASDIAVFREIAGSDTVLHYEQSDDRALAAAVKAMIAEREAYARRASEFSWIDWDESRDAFALETDRLAMQAGK